MWSRPRLHHGARHHDAPRPARGAGRGRRRGLGARPGDHPRPVRRAAHGPHAVPRDGRVHHRADRGADHRRADPERRVLALDLRLPDPLRPRHAGTRRAVPRGEPESPQPPRPRRRSAATGVCRRVQRPEQPSLGRGCRASVRRAHRLPDQLLGRADAGLRTECRGVRRRVRLGRRMLLGRQPPELAPRARRAAGATDPPRVDPGHPHRGSRPGARGNRHRRSLAVGPGDRPVLHRLRPGRGQRLHPRPAAARRPRGRRGGRTGIQPDRGAGPDRRDRRRPLQRHRSADGRDDPRPRPSCAGWSPPGPGLSRR